MNILAIGDIVGSPGRRLFARCATVWKQRGEADFIVANGENAAAGSGITPGLSAELFDAGADVLTLGDHTWDRKEITEFLDSEPRLVRPANFAPGCPGRGWTVIPTAFGSVAVISLIGRVFMGPADCPFRAADRILGKLPESCRIILVDFHAEATSEKMAMGRYLDGRVTAVWGTHTHVQTADDTLLPRGTAYLTDLGMTGPTLSILGREYAAVQKRFLTGMPMRFGVEKKTPPRLEGLRLDVDERTGKARTIERLYVTEP